MRDFKIIVALADLHIGNKRVTAADLKKQLKDHFFKIINNMSYVDAIVIAGDTLHNIISLNNDYSTLFMWFAGKIYKLAKKYNATVIWIRGTTAHDANQLQNIRSYINNDDGVDFRIYETYEETTLWGDYKVLILPDVPVKKDSIIEQFITEDKKYDLILGHGLIDQMKFFVQESEVMPTHTYVYNVDKLMASCKGPILFGHIHQYQSVDNHFYYIGPYTLLERGGINAGFVVCGIYDKDRSKFCVEHYINPDSATYYDIKITKKILEEYPIDEIVEAIDDIIEGSKANDLISLKIVRGDDLESSDKVMILENRYRKDKRFSITKKVKSKKEEELEQKNKERKEKFSYIMDANLTISDIFFKYYTEEIVPTLPDQVSPVAKLTKEQFQKILGEAPNP